MPRPGSQTSSERLTAEQVGALEARLQEGVARGLLVRSERALQHVMWRYEGLPGELIVTCYERKRKRRDHAVVFEWKGELGPMAQQGKWDEYAAARAGRTEERAAGWRDGPRARLRRAAAKPLELECGQRPILRARADLSPHQTAVYDRVHAWVLDPDRPVLTLGGYAGTGKSTLWRQWPTRCAIERWRSARRPGRRRWSCAASCAQPEST